MKKIIALLLAVVMLLSLAACGGEPDPNAGKYLGVRGEMNGVILTMEELYPGESYLELKDGGKGKLVLEGDAFNITWKLDGENFTMDIEGDACDGTLKDGVVIFDFMNMGMLLTFALEGVDVPEPTVPQSDTLEMGFYPLYAVDQDGEYTDNETIKMLGMDQTNYLICYGDGTVEVVMENDQYFCTYNETCIIDDEGGEVQYAIVEGLVELYMEGNMTFYYQLGNMEDIPEVVPSANSEAFPADVVEAFYGDWHGWCVFTNGTGDYENDLYEEFEMIARYAFDEDGVCIPWMAIYGDPEDNFKDVILTYNEDEYTVCLSGQLFGMEIQPSSYIYDSFGSLCMVIDMEGENGTLQVTVTLRHLDDEWDEYDYPCMPEDAQNYYAGMTFEELVELYELNPADLPELS
jgi:hypothetical protein